MKQYHYQHVSKIRSNNLVMCKFGDEYFDAKQNECQHKVKSIKFQLIAHKYVPTICIVEVGGFEKRLTSCDVNQNRIVER